MEFATKFNIIDDAIVKLNELADASGVSKCVLIINLVQNLNELIRMMKEEDAKNEAAILALTEKVGKLEKPEEAKEDAGTEADIE